MQMMSAAGTGYFFNTKRNRLREKLVLRKHDPVGELAVTAQALHFHRVPYRSCLHAVNTFKYDIKECAGSNIKLPGDYFLFADFRLA